MKRKLHKSYHVSKNTNSPKEVLVKLSKSVDWLVRSNVAENPNTPIEVLILLSKDYEDNVCWHVSKNPNTPIETLIELSKHQYYYVSESAKQAIINRIGLLE